MRSAEPDEDLATTAGGGPPRSGWIVRMADGTVKQRNPLTDTRVWTVPGRGNRPLAAPAPVREPIDPENHVGRCAFCSGRYLETPPEKARVVRDPDGSWRVVRWASAEQLFETVAEFRRVPNLFEILSFEYWRDNHGFELPPDIAARRRAYLADPAGRRHVLSVVTAKLRAAGRTPAEIEAMGEQELLGHASAFFGGGHDVVIARRHFVDGATDSSQLASSGTLTVDEHRQFIALTVDSVQRLHRVNPAVRYVAVFQNWLKPAGASFDHLHKQLVAIDELGAPNELVIPLLRRNPHLFNEAPVGYAVERGLVLARTEHAIAFAGFGHRFPSVEVWSTSPHTLLGDMSREEIDAMSDLIHAMHAATGAEVACNEEWHYRPVGVPERMPWRVLLKWRLSNVAGFEGATQIYVNTMDPFAVRDLVVPRLLALRDAGRIAPMLIGEEARPGPDPLRYDRA